MNRKQILMTAVLSLVLLLVVVFAAVGLTQKPPQAGQENRQSAVVINEIMSGNEMYPNSQGLYYDYIELYNPADTPADISNYKLSDKEDEMIYTFPMGTQVPPKSYLVCHCSANGEEGLIGFGLAKEGETVYLYNSANVCVQTVTLPALEKNHSFYRDGNGAWQTAAYGTPGYENTAAGYDRWLDDMGVIPLNIVFTEVQSANLGGITDSSGAFCDWVELYNAGSSTADLSGYYLSDNIEKPMKWKLEDLTMEPDTYTVLRCTGNAGTSMETNFALSKSGCSLYLHDPMGNLVTELTCPALEADQAWQQAADGSYQATAEISPGYANTPSGRQAYLESVIPTSPLILYEVMPANDRYLLQSDGEAYDWVELKNISNQPVSLADYFLTDDADRPQYYPLPDQILQPGQVTVIILSGDVSLSGRYPHAPFALSRDGCRIYLSHKDFGFVDNLHLQQVPLMGSAGRMDGSWQLHFFATPTPEGNNTNGYTAITDDPFVQTPGGIYNDVTQVSVVLSGEGDIYYTLDGSVPTVYSRRYTQPITLTETTTLRAICHHPDKLPSKVVTTGYIINENHTLPVLSISADPEALLGSSGIYTLYTQNIEIPCNMTLYEPEGSFSVDCGIKMFGHTGLQMAKKSFKVNFRGRYGSDLLTYPVYGEDGPELYDSLIVRSGQDYPQSIFRDELFTSLCRQMSDNVLAQRDKFCILYLNGEYWGIYCIKEAFGEFYYAQNRGVSEESVQVVQAPVYPSSDIYQFMNYLSNHDITDPENYAYACTVFNMDSLIDWIIIQGYSTNGDVQQNLRYFRSTETGNTYEMAFYDLDWAFYYHLPFTDVLSNGREMNWQHLRYTMKLVKNPTFRQQLIERVSYHMEHTLSNENVLARIDYYEQLLAPEVPRERDRWGGSYEGWQWQVNKMRRFITEFDHMADMVSRLQRYIGLTQAEIDQYFWRWV